MALAIDPLHPDTLYAGSYDGSGNYSFTVSYNWSGTVTPTKTGHTFKPDHKDYANVLADLINQNYTAAPKIFLPLVIR